MTKFIGSIQTNKKLHEKNYDDTIKIYNFYKIYIVISYNNVNVSWEYIFYVTLMFNVYLFI